MKFEFFKPKSTTEKPDESAVSEQEPVVEQVDQGRRRFFRAIGATALAGAGVMPEDAEAFGGAVSPEDFARDYVDDLEIPANFGSPATIKEQIKSAYAKLSPSKRRFYVMMMPGNCSGKTVLKSFDPNTGSMEVVCKSR